MDELASKYEAFGWRAQEIEGHDFAQIRNSLDASISMDGPSVIISHSVTGKGVPYMEGNYHWHHGVVTDELFLQAMDALGEKVSPRPDDTWEPGSTPIPASKSV